MRRLLTALLGLLLVASTALAAPSPFITSPRFFGRLPAGSSLLESNQDAYYRRVVERALPIMEQRLESAALLMANLIGTAWIQAGRPPPEQWHGASAPGMHRLSPGTGTEQRRVGSKSSTIFHRPGCQHARRIKQVNLIRFHSRKAARDAGRVPCKTCKPDEP